MNIALVFGGRSVEHDISVITAKQIYGLSSGGEHKIFLIYVTKQDELNLYTNKNFNLEDFKCANRYLTPICLHEGQLCYKQKLGKVAKQKIDAAIFCCHGGDGENGVLASKFLASKIPVSCGSPTALGICMDKWLTKQFLNGLKITNTPAICVNSSQSLNQVDSLITKEIGYPVILKPRYGGSSIGIQVVANKAELMDGLMVALEYDDNIVIEKELQDFTEYNCAVIGDSREAVASNIDKPEKKQAFLTFDDKYKSGGKGGKKGGMKTQARKFPADISDKLKNKLQDISVRVFKQLGLSGVVRIDFMVTGGKVYLNEINAIPGSLGYYFFVDKTFTGKDFVDKLAEIAIENYKKSKKINKEYITQLL